MGEEIIIEDATPKLKKILEEGKKHFLLSLLDYSDEVKNQADDGGKELIEKIKKRIHNDVNEYYRVSELVVDAAHSVGLKNVFKVLKQSGLQIKPFGENDGT